MKLADHVEAIRQLIDTSFRNRLGRMGILPDSLQPLENIPGEYHDDRNRIKEIREVFISETGSVKEAYEKLIEELTFTLFNRLAALKVMEAHVLHPEILTRRSQHGDRSFAHFSWLEQHPEGHDEEQEGLVRFLEYRLEDLSADIPLFSPNHPYHLLPTAIELNAIIHALNQVELDPQVEADIWKSDDVLGWLYESYNNYKKAAHKASGDKTEYNKVTIQSQVYTPRWVVKFLVDNSLGRLYLEMYPDSPIKEKYRIANAQETQIRERKPLTEIGMIDPATGSGNFLLYGFDLFYDLYVDQLENYTAEYNEDSIPELIIQHNLHGIDLDDRAVQLAQLGLYIKARRKKRSLKIDHFDIVSSDFYLPEYEEVQHLFENGGGLSAELQSIVKSIWTDLQQAYKFGSLIRLEEKFNSRLQALMDVETGTQTLFSEARLSDYRQFREEFLSNLMKVVASNTARQGLTFLNSKTSDAITFLELLTRKYDVAVANPPYTDSADYGTILKEFVDGNYRKPFKFSTNLYAAFFIKCCELTNDKGFVGLIHPHTFMFIKTFEDFRKYMIEQTHIEILVDYGLDRVNLFGPGILLDATWYVVSKRKKETEGIYFNITDNQQEKYKQGSLEIAYDDFIHHRKNGRVYILSQSKLKIIEGWPFIYWISDGFREKFKGESLDEVISIRVGLKTGNNNRFLRFWWEVDKKGISSNYKIDKKKWVIYSKGGPYGKWYGNLWAIVNWENNGKEIIEWCNYLNTINVPGGVAVNRNFYFKEGITYSASGSKGVSFRHLPRNCIFDVGGSSIFIESEEVDLMYCLALLNSNITFYLADCLNPTVNVQVGDLKRIPFVKPNEVLEGKISALASDNVEIKKQLNSFRVVETDFKQNPITFFLGVVLKDRLIAYLNNENAQLSEVLLNEAIINYLIFNVYDLSEEDQKQVEAKMGKPVGNLPVLHNARQSFLEGTKIDNEDVLEFIQNLSVDVFDDRKVQAIKSEFTSLYQTNNDLEEFCIRHQVNPINVWYWFKESKILPPGRAHEIALEFLSDAIRTILMEDGDGIIPLVGLPGEPNLIDRLEQHCLKSGFTSAQFLQLDGLLGRPLNDYLENHFFKNLSDHLNLFMYLPKTPFIWHLSSGENQGFEAYIIIYKWNRDSLFKLKTQYLSKRVEKLEFRMIQIKDSDTAQAQNEREKIRLQLEEIAVFTQKIDELIAEGYDPKLDDGVGKNIAPLQKKGMLRCDVLNEKQLERYLNTDW